MWLKPVLPELATRAEAFLDCGALLWTDNLASLKRIRTYEHLMQRVEAKQLDALFAPAPEKAAMTTPPAPATDGTISIDDFSKVDLRIAKIVKAEHIDAPTSS